MKTFVYMVRHGESPKTEGNERTRGLTDKGQSDTYRITELLKGEEIEVFVSSPYQRAILTIQELARCAGQEIVVFEDLKERIFSNEDSRMPDKELIPLLEKSFSDPNFALTGGESNIVCQSRAIAVLKELLTIHHGRRIGLGTHGAVMTLMMGYYDKQYDLDFLMHTSKPDVYRMEFDDQALVEVKRLWSIR
ncbi:histidine phosphatase family protein [Paenibacillus eucommiae]|uniref:2,3-bisphosphoglycerate-dependent phosphoglycerate mutase n=1 Tax=Paenibacillus eucommiae TaxID=1355755 RepID=A0ABS4IQ00_9BACL|nr:histidine phosphatase family protein [Paenibacillus eucommiae]MBP1989646.1 2,3-bisphosphoglycerate-dependent phosphoglycerate mutase [Paenibacillus eucommiae]